ncbi:MAG: hypothetical protein WDN76_00545 [Alphaproteobacteria bacterium]
MLQQVLIVLGAVSVVVPLFHRLRLSPVIGFLLIGMTLGPFILERVGATHSQPSLGCLVRSPTSVGGGGVWRRLPDVYDRP